MLTLHSGEWFENMKSQEFSAGVSVPYRRETFVKKRIVLDFDADFNVADASALSNNARGKSIGQINRDVDSLNHVYDSVGRVFYKDAKMSYYSPVAVSKKDSLRAVKMAGTKTYSFDSVYSRLSADRKLEAVDAALSKVQREMNDLDFKGMITADGDKLIRQHKIEAINKFTLSLSCLIFSLSVRPWAPSSVRRTWRSGDYLRAGVHRVLHFREYRLPHVTRRYVGNLVR